MPPISHHLALHALQTSQGRVDNRRPWLPVFLALPGARKALADRVDLLLDRPARAQGRGEVVHRLKPNLGRRVLVMTEVETELAMMYAGASLVRGLEEARVEGASFANRAVWDPKNADYWSVAKFQHRGADRRTYNQTRASIPNDFGFVIDLDVENFFPASRMPVVIDRSTRIAGVDIENSKAAFALLSAVTPTPGYLPVGPPLASVVGNALLTGADRWLSWIWGPGAFVRWVDDVTCGAPTDADAWATINSLQEVVLTPLGLRYHPEKTKVSPSADWSPSAPSEEEDIRIELDDDGQPHMPVYLTRPQVRALLRDLESSFGDPEKRAHVVADHLGRCVVWAPGAVRQMRAGPDMPSRTTDLAVARLSVPARSRDHSDDAAEGLLELTERDATIGRRGQAILTDMACDASLPGRTRGAAAWTLSVCSGSFDKSILDAASTLRPYSRRAVYAAAARSGEKFTPLQMATCWN